MQPNALWGPSGSLMRSKGPSQALRRPNSTENTKPSVLHREYLHLTVTKHPILHLISSPCGPKFHREPPSNPLFGFRCPSVPSSKPRQTMAHCTMPASGSFDATKLANHLPISIDRSCSTLCKGSLLPFFALRTALRHLLSPSNHGIINFPKGKPMVGTPQWAAMSTEC